MRNFRVSDIPKPDINLTEFSLPEKFVLEIGAGTGDFAIQYAKNNQKQIIVAIEKTKEKFRKFADKLDGLEVKKNILPVHANAINFVVHFVKPQTITKCYINYPNPYPKASQANKRFHNMPFIEYLKICLVDGGQIEFATNIESMAEEAKDKFVKTWGFRLVNEFVLVDPGLARTAFEKKYLDRGEACYRLLFQT